MIKSPTTADTHYRGYELQDYWGPNRNFYTVILDKIIDRYEDAFTIASNLLAVSLVIRYPDHINSHNDDRCFQYFIEEYTRKNKDKLLHYVWVREQSTSPNPHWHLMLIFNANKLRRFQFTYDADKYWKRALEKVYGRQQKIRGTIHLCKAELNNKSYYNGIRVSKNNKAMYNSVIKIHSYLAKVHTKGNAPANTKEFSASQLKRKSNLLHSKGTIK